jgi:hypothetical protein
MNRADMIRLSEGFFAALDAMDPDALRNLLTDDCVLNIETHGLVHEGRAAIVDLFSTRWDGAAVTARHHDFSHTADPAANRIASAFTATYSGPEAPEPKSNANIFTLRGNLICRIQVYMAGANTVRS